jgi:ribosomal-protein-alanine N-acetyltransferase
VIVEPVTAGDAPKLADIHALAFRDSWSAGEIATLVRGAGAFGFLAHRDREIAGFVLCRTIADEAEILTLATAPASRRCGVAKQLLDSASSHAAGRGALRLFLEVAEDNNAATSLYQGSGFKQVGVRTGYYSRPGGAIAALVMRRDLNR